MAPEQKVDRENIRQISPGNWRLAVGILGNRRWNIGGLRLHSRQTAGEVQTAVTVCRAVPKKKSCIVVCLFVCL